MKPNILIYTKYGCPYCNNAKIFLRDKNLEFTEIKVEEERSKTEEMKLKQNWKTLPMIFVNDHFIGGYSDMQELQKKGEFEKLLN